MSRGSSLARLVLHRFAPAALYRGRTAAQTLAVLDRELARCGSGQAAGAVQKLKPRLFAELSCRFGSTPAQALTLKILNLALARHHFRARSASLLSRPFGLVVDPSNVCRLACPGCVHSTASEASHRFDWPNGTLSEDRLSALFRRYGPFAIGVYFCDYGEPLLNLNTPKFIRLAKRYLMGTALSTSLSVQRFDPEAYVESGLDFMVLSIDGATQPVYERFRRNGSLELVLGNLRRLVETRRRLRKRTPVLSWNFLAFEHNAHEIPAAARMARRHGVNQFRVVEPFDVTWDDPGIRPAAVRPGVRRLDWASTTNLPENWNPFPGELETVPITRAFEQGWAGPLEDDVPSPGHTCHWLYKNMILDATGRVMPCCGAPRPDGALVFATFNGDTGDPFNSGKYRQARSFFRGAASPSADAPYCSRCEWDQTVVNIGGPEIRRYFRAADPAYFDRRSLRMLADW